MQPMRVAFSADGRYIGWASGNNVMLLDTKTNRRRPLMTSEQSAQLSYVYWNFGWSLDGKSLAFKARLRDQTTNVLVAADADSGEGFGIVYSGPDHINEDFTWHPDGLRVVFSILSHASKASKLVMVDRTAPAVRS